MKKMGKALNHHYNANKHHPEHWEYGITQMNLLEILEMLADWKAASERMKEGSLLLSIEKNQTRFKYSDEFKNLLLNTTKYLNW